MTLENLTLTPALLSWLTSIATPGLVARQEGAAVVVTRADGSELSAPEQARVRGVLAANQAEPLQIRKKLRYHLARVTTRAIIYSSAGRTRPERRPP